jgi:hypothetical protein
MVEIFENKICERLHHSASIKKAGGLSFLEWLDVS